jgi:antitoxin VapB
MVYYFSERTMIVTKSAKLFVNGGSQAVRLPAEFRFEGADEVYIRRDSVNGDLILSTKPVSNTWEDFFALRDAAEVPTDFMSDRPMNTPLVTRDPFGES